MPTLRFYHILGIKPDATQQEIRVAYLRLVKQLHPDHNPDDTHAETAFKEVVQAYKTLKDPGMRYKYDLENGVEPKMSASESRSASSHTAVEQTDVRMKLFLTLEDVWRGGTKSVRYDRRTLCVVCEGSGAVQLTKRKVLCHNCKGIGVVGMDYGVKVGFPAGIRENGQLRVVGSGHYSRQNGQSGDLIITVKYIDHPYLTVKGNDIHYGGMIGLDQYIEGGAVKVPSGKGIVSVAVPPRFPDGGFIRLKGEGLPAHNGLEAGDLVVTVRLFIPRHLSAAERDRMKELLNHSGFHVPLNEEGLIPKEMLDK